MSEPSASVLLAAFMGRCPRCGRGGLFRGYLAVGDSCPKCGLDYKPFDAGDGPAVFVILIVGAIVASGALILEANVHPPYWVQVAIWIPATAVLSLIFLRLAKALLLVLQYRNQAREGRKSD